MLHILVQCLRLPGQTVFINPRLLYIYYFSSNRFNNVVFPTTKILYFSYIKSCIFTQTYFFPLHKFRTTKILCFQHNERFITIIEITFPRKFFKRSFKNEISPSSSRDDERVLSTTLKEKSHWSWSRDDSRSLRFTRLILVVVYAWPGSRRV